MQRRRVVPLYLCLYALVSEISIDCNVDTPFIHQGTHCAIPMRLIAPLLLRLSIHIEYAICTLASPSNLPTNSSAHRGLARLLDLGSVRLADAGCSVSRLRLTCRSPAREKKKKRSRRGKPMRKKLRLAGWLSAVAGWLRRCLCVDRRRRGEARRAAAH